MNNATDRVNQRASKWNEASEDQRLTGTVLKQPLLGCIDHLLIEGSVNKYLYPVIALIVLVTLVPMLFEIFKEWQSKRYKK